jgi:2-C-methyl-D-erythritol 2,4-cyclodiphosphate synthase
VSGKRFRIVNADITIIAQAPKLAPYIEAMCTNISTDLQVDAGRINVKATTTEYMGFTGRGEGIAALAVILLEDAAR